MNTISFDTPVVLYTPMSEYLDETSSKDILDFLCCRSCLNNDSVVPFKIKSDDGKDVMSDGLYGSEAVLRYCHLNCIKCSTVYNLVCNDIITLAPDVKGTLDLLYFVRYIDNRNNRIKRLISLGSPKIILAYESRVLWEKLEGLFYNNHNIFKPEVYVDYDESGHKMEVPYQSVSDFVSGAGLDCMIDWII